MCRTLTTIIASASLAGMLLAITQPATAQRGGAARRLFGPIHLTTLAQLEEVQQELKLTDQQKQSVTRLDEEFNTAVRNAFQNAAGDFDKMREDIAKVSADFSSKFNEALQEPQQKRARELYVQLNGPVVLTNDAITKELKVTDEQKQKIDEAAEDSRTEVFSSFQDLQNMTEQQRTERISELIETRDNNLLAVLTDEQKEQFESLKGAKIEVDLDKLPGFGG